MMRIMALMTRDRRLPRPRSGALPGPLPQPLGAPASSLDRLPRQGEPVLTAKNPAPPRTRASPPPERMPARFLPAVRRRRAGRARVKPLRKRESLPSGPAPTFEPPQRRPGEGERLGKSRRLSRTEESLPSDPDPRAESPR
jgi:hypothetical protein